MSMKSLLVRALGAAALIGLVATSNGCKRTESASSASSSSSSTSPSSSTSQPAPAASSELKKVKLGYVGLTCDTDLFVAYEKGFFKDEGLDVEMVKMPWPDLREALSLGKVDATHHLVMFLLKPIESGVNIRLTAGVHKGCLRVQVPVDSDVQSVKDLKGKKIAVPGMGTPPFIFASRVLMAAGLDPNKDVEWKVFPPAEAELALNKKLVDAVADSEPIGTILTSKKLVRNVADQATDAPYKDEYCCAVIVSGKLCTEDPQTAAKITRAILKGSKWTQVNPTEAARLAVEKKYIASTPELNAAALAKLSYIPSVSGGQAAVVSATEEMKKIGMLKPSTSPQELAKTAFFPLPGVTDEWINNLQVEKVAGGEAPTDAALAAAVRTADVKEVKTCCVTGGIATKIGK